MTDDTTHRVMYTQKGLSVVLKNAPGDPVFRLVASQEVLTRLKQLNPDTEFVEDR